MAQPFAEPCSRGIIKAEPFLREPGRETSPSQRRRVLAACVLASSMAFIDGSALTVALPTLRAHFGADLASVQWVLNGYVLALACLTLIGGALADVYGKARMLGLGCILFGLASVACAMAPTPVWLISARVVQGMAAAIVTPASLALIGATYPRTERNQAIGIWAAASALTTAGGPVLGGWLTETFGWPSVFWINPSRVDRGGNPAGICTSRPPRTASVRRDRRRDSRHRTWGARLLSQIGPSEPRIDAGTSIQSLAMLTSVAIVGFAVYVLWERRTDHPMTPPYLVRNRAFVGLNGATLMIYAGLSIMFFLLPFDLVDRRALSSTNAGLAFLPFTLGVGLFSKAFGNLADKIGVRVLLIVGPVGAAIAYVWMALSQETPLMLGVIVPMTLLGLSFAVLVTPLTSSVMSSVKQKDEGLASGVNNATSRIAQLAGIALAAGFASFTSGYKIGLFAAAIVTVAGAFTVVMMVPAATKIKPGLRRT